MRSESNHESFYDNYYRTTKVTKFVHPKGLIRVYTSSLDFSVGTDSTVGLTVSSLPSLILYKYL